MKKRKEKDVPNHLFVKVLPELPKTLRGAAFEKTTATKLHLLRLNERSDKHTLPFRLLDFNELLPPLHSVCAFSHSTFPPDLGGKKTKQHMSHCHNTHARESGSPHIPATARNTSTTRDSSCMMVACHTHVLN